MNHLKKPCQLISRLYTGLTKVEGTCFMGSSKSRQSRKQSSSSQEMNAEAVIVKPQKEHKATAEVRKNWLPRSIRMFSKFLQLIFLHGLGDTGHGWADGFQMLQFQHIKCICPHAPVQRVTLNAGMKMPSWFDIQGLDSSSPQDEPGIKEASKKLQAMIEAEEKSGIPSNRIFIGGFSQGGAVALYTAFAVNRPVGGVVGLSTWFPLHTKHESPQVPKYNKEVPVLQCHGTFDPMVQLAWGEETKTFIQTFNHNVEFKKFEGMGHSSCPEEMKDVKTFLEKHTAS